MDAFLIEIGALPNVEKSELRCLCSQNLDILFLKIDRKFVNRLQTSGGDAWIPRGLFKIPKAMSVRLRLDLLTTRKISKA